MDFFLILELIQHEELYVQQVKSIIFYIYVYIYKTHHLPRGIMSTCVDYTDYEGSWVQFKCLIN